MNRAFHFEGWMAAAAALLAGAVFFRFCVRGYSYIAHMLTFIAALLALHRYAPPRLWQAAAVLVSIGLFYFCIVEIPIIANSRTDDDAGRKYIVVLGAEVRGTRPTPSLYYRLTGARELLYLNPDSIAIVSGGQGDGEDISEAQCMYNWLTEAGVDPARIIMEVKATSTMENLEYSFDIIRSLGGDPAGNTTIVSSSYHLFRAKSMAKKLGVDAAGCSCSPGNPLLALNFYIREAFGVTHLWVFGK